MHEYWLYGSRVESDTALCNSAWPAPELQWNEITGVRLSRACSIPGIELRYGMVFQSCHGRQLSLHCEHPLDANCPGCIREFRVEDVVTFQWCSGSGEVQYACAETDEPTLLGFWFNHIFLPIYLALEEDFDFMHGSAVDIAGSAALFIAPSTGGKSTLAQYFVERGHALLADDKLCVRRHGRRWYGVPAHPHLRDWREFEVLGTPVEHYTDSALLLGAIYALEQAPPDDTVHIGEVSGFDRLEYLIPQHLYDFLPFRQRRLQRVAALAAGMPLLRLSRPWDLMRLDEVYRVVCETQVARSHATWSNEDPVVRLQLSA